MWVRFLQDRTVLEADGSVEVAFKAGQEIDLTDTSAERWIQRGIAIAINGPTKTKAATKAGAKAAIADDQPDDGEAADTDESGTAEGDQSDAAPAEDTKKPAPKKGGSKK